jgi:hypothetical protein
MIGSTATLHAVAPSSASVRTTGGGLDPWLLAERLGGAKLVLPSTGSVNLNSIGVTEAITDIVRLTFRSTSDVRANHRIRVRVQVGAKVSELSPGLVQYDVHPSLDRGGP